MLGQWYCKVSTLKKFFFSVCCCCSVTLLCLTLRIHGLQHARIPCPLPSSRAFSNSDSWWCHPTILSSVPFFSCPQSALGSFLMSWLFAAGGQGIGASASASVLPMKIQDWSPLGWITLVSLLPSCYSRVFSSTTVQKHQFFRTQPSLWPNFYVHTWLLEKP